MTDQPDDDTANADIRQNARAMGMPEEMIDAFLASERSGFPMRVVAGVEQPYRICGSTAEGMFSPLVCDYPIGHGPLYDSRVDDAPWEHGQRSGARWRGWGIEQEMRHPEPTFDETEHLATNPEATAARMQRDRGLPGHQDEPPDDRLHNILTVANSLIHGTRQAEYGHPLDTYGRLALLVNVLYGTEFLAEDMIIWHHLNKIARRVQDGRYGYHEDGVTDTAGYAGVEEIMHLERRRRGREATDKVMGRLRGLANRDEDDDD